MSSRKVLINGVTYIRSRDAARAVNLAADYISRLARQGAITGELVSNIWFVELGSLRKFIEEQERQKAILRARFAQMRREEQRLARASLGRTFLIYASRLCRSSRHVHHRHGKRSRA
jgi:hypothetical protein